MQEEIQRQILEHIAVQERVLKEMTPAIQRAAEALIACYRNGKKLLLCGNGGSAADAQHLAAEFVGRFLRERDAKPALALTTNTSILTAIGNDYDFDRVFARQIEAWGEPGDVLLAISTSGNSSNVVCAVESAKKRGILTIGLTGRDGGKLATLCDIPLIVPSSETPRIQEAHITIGHILCDLVERTFCQG